MADNADKTEKKQQKAHRAHVTHCSRDTYTKDNVILSCTGETLVGSYFGLSQQQR